MGHMISLGHFEDAIVRVKRETCWLEWCVFAKVLRLDAASDSRLFLALGYYFLLPLHTFYLFYD